RRVATRALAAWQCGRQRTAEPRGAPRHAAATLGSPALGSPRGVEPHSGVCMAAGRDARAPHTPLSVLGATAGKGVRLYAGRLGGASSTSDASGMQRYISKTVPWSSITPPRPSAVKARPHAHRHARLSTRWALTPWSSQLLGGKEEGGGKG